MTTGRASDDTNPTGEGPDRDHSGAAADPLAGASVRTLAVYPAKDEPGQELPETAVEPEGLRGDRRKKMPVHLVGAEETTASTRANPSRSPAPGKPAGTSPTGKARSSAS